MTGGDLIEAILPTVNLAGEWLVAARAGLMRHSKAAAAPASAIHTAVTAGDLLVQTMIERDLDALDRIDVMGEEQTAQASRLRRPDAAWHVTVDPLDGTHAFTTGCDDYCTMLAVFDGEQIAAGLVHFPSVPETFTVGSATGIRHCTYGIGGPVDACRSAGHQATTVVPPAGGEDLLLVHYRLLKPPYTHLADALCAAGLRFATLAGDPAVEPYEPLLLGSNGSLLRHWATQGAGGCVAPYIAWHDVAPLAAFFAAVGAVRFYAVGTAPGLPWQMLALDRVLAGALTDPHQRCRVIMAADDRRVDWLEMQINAAEEAMNQ